jgi:hypothetical protein
MSSDLATWEDKVSLMQQCPTTPVGVKQTLKTGGGSAMHGNQVANGPGVPTSSVVGQNGQCNIVLDV